MCEPIGQARDQSRSRNSARRTQECHTAVRTGGHRLSGRDQPRLRARMAANFRGPRVGCGSCQCARKPHPTSRKRRQRGDASVGDNLPRISAPLRAFG